MEKNIDNGFFTESEVNRLVNEVKFDIKQECVDDLPIAAAAKPHDCGPVLLMEPTALTVPEIALALY